MSWDRSSMPDQTGRTVVVTGANSGLGYEATAAFAGNGADVVMACRSLGRGRQAAEEIRETLTGDAPAWASAPDSGSLTVMKLDLANLDSATEFVESFTERFDDLHVLCNNAGVMAVPRGETADGFERQFGINHLGHFALTGHLLPALRDTDGETRVVTQSSGVHENGSIDFQDLQREQSYDKWDAYAQSKLANVLFGYELDRRLNAAEGSSARAGDEDGADTVSVVCHPGYANTNLQRRGPEESGSTLRLWAMKLANALLAQPASQGVLPMLYAATDDDIDGGEYIGPGGLMNARGAPEEQESNEESYDPDVADRLWAVSEELTGVEYDLPDA
ncbi:oxidoreductase [Halolamina salifodinae]|uniref:NAD(P)-dependent dehydrogenase (Short-subunit alcohol dehydrogenase family) n=1 Tax=Halolamina salifodinae TaxID=1202767 RepID=A0A8T4GV38_9EURY|nr:oxidoreductase [Halolamina salifodinae]MBP1986270.1 NAD(P)-dependent dehydrogenase (short-subunit alcohol dehydrogenase family) [Halolamina salifodinae]